MILLPIDINEKFKRQLFKGLIVRSVDYFCLKILKVSSAIALQITIHRFQRKCPCSIWFNSATIITPRSHYFYYATTKRGK